MKDSWKNCQMSKKKLTLVFFKRGLEEVLEEKWLSSMFLPIILSCDFILLMQFSIISDLSSYLCFTPSNILL